MIAQLACCLVFATVQQDGQIWNKIDLPVRSGSIATVYYQEAQNPMEPPRFSPKKFGEAKIQWEFPWIVAGFVHLNDDTSPAGHISFRVYAQEHFQDPSKNKGPQVARMLLRLWEFNAERLHLVHNPDYHKGLVDVFLCFGGKAGGEQLFDEEIVRKPNGSTDVYKANTIYIYDTPSFTDPVEMAREVAHEYGHATLLPIGGFKVPEYWADGYLAERLGLRWMRDALAAKELTPDDMMGATKEGLDKWIAANIDPLVMSAATTQPTPDLIADQSSAGMNAFIGLALYIDTIYGDKVFERSIKIADLRQAKEYPDTVILAAEEPDQITLKIPATLIRKAIWIPLGTGKLTGAQILKKDPSGWVQVQVGANPIVITNAH